ncbi:MAG: hypothetical protein AAFV07_13415, partial [Bacteroidota bacterium]
MLAIFWAFYKLLLERESFFSANRTYLIGGLLLVLILPFLSLPQMMDRQGLLFAWADQLSESTEEEFISDEFLDRDEFFESEEHFDSEEFLESEENISVDPFFGDAEARREWEEGVESRVTE